MHARKQVTVFLILLMITLPAGANDAGKKWSEALQYIPAKTDVFLSVDLKAVRSFLLRSGISEEEMLKIFAGSGKRKSPFAGSAYKEFFTKLKNAVLVADADEFRKKKPTRFLVLFEGPEDFNDLENALAAVKGETIKGSSLYLVDASDNIYFCKTGTVYLIGYKEYIKDYMTALEKGEKTISRAISSLLETGRKSDLFLYIPLARFLQQNLKKTITMGKGMGGTGLEENVFLKSLMGMEYFTVEADLSSKISLSITMRGQNADDARNLTMLNHFFIVGASFVLPFANSLSRKMAKKNLKIERTSLTKFQEVLGRIRTEEKGNAARISFTLNKKESALLLSSVKEGIQNSLRAQKTDSHRKKPFELLEKNDMTAFRNVVSSRSRARAKNSRGQTLLYRASLGGNRQAVMFLLRRGAGINDRNDNDQRTPLHGAVEGRDIGTATLLIEKGADVNAKDTYGYYPLHVAVKNENIDMVKLIIAGGGEVNSKTLDGTTPLHIAAETGNRSILRLLLEAGADKGEKDFYGDTPLDRARKKGRKEAAKELQ